MAVQNGRRRPRLRAYVDIPVDSLVAIIRVLLGGLVSISLNLIHPVTPAVLVIVGLVAPLLLAELGRVTSPQVRRARRVRSEAERLDSARKSIPVLAGVSEDLADILETRREELVNKLPVAEPPNGSGDRR